MKMKPTIGRVVWYKPMPAHDDSFTDQMNPALICYVHSDEMVNLSVSDSNGNQFGGTSVPLFQGTPEDCPAGSCCWMPYQKQQAAKEEQAA